MEVLTQADVKRMLLPDLRVALRSRGLTPAGGIDALRQRLNEYLQAVEDGLIPSAAPQGATGGHVQSAPAAPAAVYHPNAPSTAAVTNNYARTEGQNLGNFMTDRNSSRVLAPPGGRSNVSLSDGSADVAPHHPPKQHFSAPEAPLYAQIPLAQAKAAAAAQQSSSVFGGQGGQASNNYARPDSQNVGNFMTDRNTSRVLKPPGGGSSIVFGS
jgi:SPIRAL1-like protein